MAATKLTVSVRDATREDVPLIYALIRELAEYEREPKGVKISEADLARDGFGAAPPLFRVFIGEVEAAGPVGFALVHTAYSTWEGRCMYLEDIFVRLAYRAKGVGGALFRRVVQEAKDTGSARLVFQVLDWNKPSRDWYESIGAQPHPQWITYRMYQRDFDSLLSKP
jgi:GNAT superfamily N-acetyltransferase